MRSIALLIARKRSALAISIVCAEVAYHACHIDVLQDRLDDVRENWRLGLAARQCITRGMRDSVISIDTLPVSLGLRCKGGLFRTEVFNG
jgi:hypothetical protein